MEESDIIKEKANGWLVALSILIPLAGLIIFITQRDKQPKTAKISGICALISTFVLLISTFLIIFFINKNTDTFTDEEKIKLFKDEIEIKIMDSLSEWYIEKNSGNDEADIYEYMIKGVKNAEIELKNKGIKGVYVHISENIVSLDAGRYYAYGKILDNSQISWETGYSQIPDLK